MKKQTLRRRLAGVLTAAGISAAALLLAATGGLEELYRLLDLQPTVPVASVLQEDSPLLVHLLDVGQGDSILVQTQEQVVLIDAGESENATGIAAYLHAAGIEKLDFVIATHPHADHIGALYETAVAFGAQSVMIPRMSEELANGQSSYRSFARAFADGSLQAIEAQIGDVYELGGGVTLTVLGPLGGDADNLNHYSIVCRVDYQNASFLFTGDMEAKNETASLSYFDPPTLQADVLKLAHHGSKTSTTARWLDAVSPSVAAVSVGAGNSYNHPNESVLERLVRRNIPLYRTDHDGAIVFATNGENISVYTENADESFQFAA